MLEETEIEQMPLEPHDAIEQEWCAWDNFALSSEADEESESEEDPEFLEHSYGRYVFLSKAPKSMPPSVAPPNFLVETLTGLTQMLEKDAKKFVKLYCELCRLLGIDEVNTLRRFLSLPVHDVSMKDKLQTTDQEAHDYQATQQHGEDESQDNEQSFEYASGCPWPDCKYTSLVKYHMSIHFLTVYLNCVWQCPEKGCEHCVYLKPRMLERHRMSCHIGSPLQCGHPDCSQVFVADTWTSRGHMNYASLQGHFETYFNQTLQNCQSQPSDSEPILPFLSQTREPQKPLPTDAAYVKVFAEVSSLYLSQGRRKYRLGQNYTFLAAHKIKRDAIEVRGSTTCTGFSYGHRHFACADSVSLTLDTAVLIFVPSFSRFTVAPTCNYCIHVMSLISRPFASLPLPFHFLSKHGKHKRKRTGIGSTINDHTSFLQVVEEERLRISPMADKYAEFQKSSPQRIFVVDFESVRRSQSGLPLCPIEITVA